VVGPTAKVNAAIVTKRLISYGEIHGEVTANEQVTLKGPAVQTGDISTPSISVESGSTFNGSITMKRGAVTELRQNEMGEHGSAGLNHS
jgi:cytoskeletal protein CcmA (bactofilin family)